MPCRRDCAIRSCRIFERVETFYLHLTCIIKAERSTKAYTCTPVPSRIAGSPNPVSRIPIIAIVTLESRPILDGIGSASVAKWYPTGQFVNMAVEIPNTLGIQLA